MCTVTKNGKHRTNNINTVILFFIVLLLFNIRTFAEGPGKKEGYIIVIDPGHGGKDPGAIGSNSFEKNITLAVALKTGEYIEQNLKNVKVVYTRKMSGLTLQIRIMRTFSFQSMQMQILLTAPMEAKRM
jgi:N-acetylmuramoyl-L-alanine amidase